MSNRTVLVINAGSSSLKFSVFRLARTQQQEMRLALRGQIDGIGIRPRLDIKDADGASLAECSYSASEVASAREAVAIASSWLHEHSRIEREQVCAVGHRIVHGGADFFHPVIVDDAVFAALQQLIPLAPLHQPHNLEAISAIRETQPQLVQVACFDTAFHRTHPPLADCYALPLKYYESGVRRYGFHGLSYEYIASVLPQIAPAIARRRVIVAHLGNGASLCAIDNGISVDTTMGFSPLDGVPMGTRPGTIDPGVLLHLVGQCGMKPDDLERLLYHESGLLGLSGISSDMRVLLDSADSRAQFAIDYFVHQIAKQIGALAATLSGLDGLVFTGGIGEHAPAIRMRIMQQCAWLGLKADAEANIGGTACISMPDSAVAAWVIPTNEELMIARQACALAVSGN